MKLTLHPLALPLRETFTISRGSLTTQYSLIAELSHDGVSGYGEVTANTYYGHSLTSIVDSLESLRPELESWEPDAPESLHARLIERLPDDSFAVCVADLAAHDLYSRLHHQTPLQRWGLDASRIPASSYTIPIDSTPAMVRRLNEQPGWPCYKIKLGTDRDVEIVRALREHTDARLRVDANCGWTAAQTVELSRELKDLGVEFIEQPLPADADGDDKRRVFEESALPVIADEDCQTEDDVRRCRDVFHGVNVKLCKCGGLTPAVRMLREARSLNLQTMVGCMVESSVGISAAAQLLPLLDYADLDGAVLLADEPCTGVRLVRGQVHWASGFGTGAGLQRGRLPEFTVDPGSISGTQQH